MPLPVEAVIILCIMCLFSFFFIVYIYNYQKKVKRHINQNDKMYEMLLEIYKRV